MITNSPLQTDLYQLTMAAAYWQAATAEQESVFHLFFRRLPFKGGYAIAAGLEPALEWLESFRFGTAELDYLAGLKTKAATPLFKEEFLGYLGDLRLKLDIDAVPEGELVFAHEPVLRVQGPILHAQLAETALLNILNFQTLVATKAARVCHAAARSPVVEFGYRRAQGPDGGYSASRAAWIGGCTGTSNVLAGQRFGIPVLGTHAHSWVMSFDDELEAFERYAEAMPDNSTLLVDTYDTLKGVDHAITVARKLREKGHELNGIRLDSGDLAWLSQQARAKLDAAGFPDVKVVASNDLDEHIIESLRHQGARIDTWGVGTNLVTAADQPALGGVYKLAALRKADGSWQPRIKLSEQTAKSSIPGRLQVRRFESEGMLVGDAIYDVDRSISGEVEIVDPSDPIRRKKIAAGTVYKDVLQPAMKAGARVFAPEPLAAARERCQAALAKLHPGILRLANPHSYPAGLEQGLYQERERLLASFR
ncbi:nicotinate phosphoribosyltransferase [Luteolibacter sp. GHJ8]|uniref:Nicotinate phosphoribosyltransferase n=1 Tax=Luteolibacter rhizosphaerae TaxID=2989719 RepID=A0ABT3G0X7_9BACT|nr:nicotinate phosphoribosyltransferase [Luteolibacter rhizosphaerae]MCW1913493.1 nicotinate phosphoribosyltransferase [Luteolibacter rhizosphaerae]